MPRRHFLAPVALAATLVVAACSEPESTTVAESSSGWTCANGERIELLFYPDRGLAVLVRAGQNLEMQAVPAGSGFSYASGPTTIRGSGNELQLTVGMSTTSCRKD